MKDNGRRGNIKTIANGLLGLIMLMSLAERAGSVGLPADEVITPSPGNIVIGAPWQGEPGIRESLSQIMQRGWAKLRVSGVQPYRILPFRTDPTRPNHPQNPTSPESSEWPGHTGQQEMKSSLSISGPFTPQTPGPINFTGATLSDTLAFPPDSMGAVGPSQYIVAVNGRIRSFNKTTGAADGVLDLDTDVFFSSVMTPSPPNFTSDPRIRYDRLSGRWFIIMIDVPGGTGNQPNRVMIAVSSGGTITSLSNFTFFQFQHDLVGPTPNADTGKFADYPTLGIDANALYIGINVFTSTGPFSNTTGFVVQKTSVLGAGPITVTAFRGLISSDGPFTPQGVDNYDPAATEGYFIGVSNASFGSLVLRRVGTPGGTPSISDNISITVATTSFPLTVPHLGNTGGNSGKLDALDDRLFAAHIRNGRLWTAHNIGVNSSGTTSGANRNGSRWYELTGVVSPGTPSVFQSGTVFDAAPSTPRYYWIPSIMVSGQGHSALGFSTAASDEHANAGTVGRLATDASGTMQTPVLYTNSSTAYNPPGDPGGSSGRRWGDYSYTSLDPEDDMTIWTIQEFCNATNSYGVQVVKLLAPLPATPFLASPSNISTGQSSVNVNIAGTTVSGSGFFDPGPGFTKRISAAVPGLTVNSVTYTDPNHVTLDLSTVGSTGGARSVTVTNPDGQSATSAAPILTVCPTITISPSTVPNGAFNTPYTQTFIASSGTGPYSYGLTGALPAGMNFSGPTLSGTPTGIGSFPFTVAATDSLGCAGSQKYTLTIMGDTTTTIISHLPNPSTINLPATINYAVTSAAGTPEGSVTVGDGTDSCTGTVAAGTCSLTFTTAGSKTLAAQYAGDVNFNPSTSAGAAHTVTTTLPVMILETLVSYQTIQEAYTAASLITANTIQIQAFDFSENLSFGNPASVTLKGGYNPPGFSIITGSSSITGSMMIGRGTVTVENIVIH